MPRGVYERKPKNPDAPVAAPTKPRKLRQKDADPDFIPALTAGGGMLIVGAGPGPEPIVFCAAQVEKIADLLLQHYEA